ncbi:MAG: chemotaxis protein CheC [Candidatus Nanohaloarchaea archaeon]
MKNSKLTELQRDGISEIGNIGAGRVATRLSDITGKRVNLSVPQVDIIPPSATENITELAENPHSPIVSVFSPLKGIGGGIVLSFQKKEYSQFLNLLEEDEDGSNDNLLEIGEETADIYLDSMEQFLELNVDTEEPDLIFLPLEGLFKNIVAEIGSESEEESDILVVKTVMEIEDVVKGEITMIIEIEETDRIIDALEKRMG